MNAQCVESGVNMTMCVCLPGFTGNGLDCFGQFNLFAPTYNA